MADLLDSVKQKSDLVGQNRLELLMFRLNGRQLYGINVFKVKEILPCPRLTDLPKLNPVIRGIANVRGETISIIDLSSASGGRPIKDLSDSFIVIAEYNRSTQGFLVGSVDKIVNVNWANVLPPPKGIGKENYLTAVTKVDEDLVSILDVEKVLNEISPVNTEIDEEILNQAEEKQDAENKVDVLSKKILIVDDSSVARNQVKKAINTLGIETILCKDGKDALNTLNDLGQNGSVHDQISLIISDIEMPEMDGYTLTSEIRKSSDLSDMYIILHTSLSGIFNEAMIGKVGANDFIAKFDPNDLANAVFKAIEKQ